MTTHEDFTTRFPVNVEDFESSLGVTQFLILSDAPSRTQILGSGITANVDGYYAENHSGRVSKTQYPVESGARLTDHAEREPYSLKLKGWVSDLMPEPHTIGSTPLNQRAGVAWQAICDQKDLLETVTVVTSLRTYRNMMIIEAKAPVDESTGLSLLFDLEFEEVLFSSPGLDTLEQAPPAAGPAAERATAQWTGGVLLRPCCCKAMSTNSRY